MLRIPAMVVPPTVEDATVVVRRRTRRPLSRAKPNLPQAMIRFRGHDIEVRPPDNSADWPESIWRAQNEGLKVQEAKGLRSCTTPA